MAKISLFCKEKMDDNVKKSLNYLSKKKNILEISILPDVYQKEHTKIPSGITVVTKEVLLPEMLFGVGCGISVFTFRINEQIIKSNTTKIMDIICNSIKDKQSIEKIFKSIDTKNPILDFGEFIKSLDIINISDLWRNDIVSNMRFNLLKKEVFDEYVNWPEKDIGNAIIEGNHFIELQIIEEVYDKDYLNILGLSEGDILLMIHLEDEGLNTKIEKKFLDKYDHNEIKYNSKEGDELISLTNISQRYCFLNRIIIANTIFKSLKDKGINLEQVSFILNTTHSGIFKNQTKDGVKIYHTSGTTLALPPRNENLSGVIREKGQPLILPGALGMESYILKTSMGTNKSSLTVNHGLGRKISKEYARSNFKEEEVIKTFKYPEFIVKKVSNWDLVSQMSICYKDINEILGIMEKNDLVSKVAKLRPLGTIKG